MVQYLCAAYSLGGPLNLERDDYPWNVPFYPFPFTLEPLTPDSLAKYVYAGCRTPSLQPETYPFRATWDQWGRGYQDGSRGKMTQSTPSSESPSRAKRRRLRPRMASLTSPDF